MKNARMLLDFIKEAKTAYHTVEIIKERLIKAGFSELREGDFSAFSDGRAHFVTRSDSSIIAFFGRGDSFSIAATHGDTPTFKVKGDLSSGAYTRLDTEKYGGAILYSWLDRPLSVAGRAVVDTGEEIAVRTVDIGRPVAVIPSVAIHQNRSVNDNLSLNAATDMIPLLSVGEDGSLVSLLADKLGVEEGKILSHDLFLYNAECGAVLGADNGLILSPRLDNAECTFAALEGFLSAENSGKSVAVLAVFDNEEVGSATKAGADSTFLSDTLRKIAATDEKYYKMLDCSLMLSADNAHAKHPNHPELSDRLGSPTLGSGVALKYNANQRYTTDSVSAALVKKLAERAGARLCEYYCRADMPCGSTLGSISTTHVGIMSADIGLPQLAMHSAMETAAVSDLSDMIALMRAHFSSSVVRSSEGYIIK